MTIEEDDDNELQEEHVVDEGKPLEEAEIMIVQVP